MFIRLLLLFALIPMAELALLIWVGGRIGLLPTLVLVAATGVIGITAAKMQGFLIMNRIKSSLSRQQMPTLNMIEGLLILVGGGMLLTPGLITDVLGFTFILPFSRPRAARLVRKHVGNHLKKKSFSSNKTITFGFSNFNKKKHRGSDNSAPEEENVYDIGSPDDRDDD
ncbi:FxsA family protein [Halarsenatibacter silvermanii]|uniref:UPF0716 protein FxsA n=1 Tax=Halarsenatibacter silvermanii TaxID=321763 RepID=A0A1G9PST6_9FIRM|nr:FxsA family protein [Halarsenatibacter silvermanii]SDM01551.1 UPF0716 protein FxsA [Halarsenatibacter silvermanii]